MLSRRLLLAFTIAFCANNIVLQIFIVVHASLLMACYVLIVGPMNEDIEDLLSTHNETLVLFFSSYVFLFSEFTTDPLALYTFGTCYLVLFGAALFINISVALYLGGKMAKL